MVFISSRCLLVVSLVVDTPAVVSLVVDAPVVVSLVVDTPVVVFILVDALFNRLYSGRCPL